MSREKKKEEEKEEETMEEEGRIESHELGRTSKCCLRNCQARSRPAGFPDTDSSTDLASWARITLPPSVRSSNLQEVRHTG